MSRHKQLAHSHSVHLRWQAAAARHVSAQATWPDARPTHHLTLGPVFISPSVRSSHDQRSVQLTSRARTDRLVRHAAFSSPVAHAQGPTKPRSAHHSPIARERFQCLRRSHFLLLCSSAPSKTLRLPIVTLILIIQVRALLRRCRELRRRSRDLAAFGFCPAGGYRAAYCDILAERHSSIET